ncbi:unnamed protein product [Arabidopsis thaliana]|uniref:Uncharacterized protein n=1 Tax=Arabidopsis thaliana TaxID=3702 RepID=A0A5S9XHJ9_ARATH|nr:unnamed protein product [Arabidopsis thaliana]
MAGCSMMKVDRTFPDLKEIPVDLATRFRQMIESLRLQIQSRGEDDISSMIEASVYLLDHPLDGSRSSSPTICGFARVLPTIFVTFRNKRLETMVFGASVDSWNSRITFKNTFIVPAFMK